MLQHVRALRCHGSQCSPGSTTTLLTVDAPAPATAPSTPAPAEVRYKRVMVFSSFLPEQTTAIDAVRGRAGERETRETSAAAFRKIYESAARMRLN